MHSDVTRESLIAGLEAGWRAGDAKALAGCFAPLGQCVTRRIGRGRSGRRGASIANGRRELAREFERKLLAAPGSVLSFTAVSYGSDQRIWTEWVISLPGPRAAPLAYGVSILQVDADGIHNATIYMHSGRRR